MGLNPYCIHRTKQTVQRHGNGEDPLSSPPPPRPKITLSLSTGDGESVLQSNEVTSDLQMYRKPRLCPAAGKAEMAERSSLCQSVQGV